MKGGTAYYSLGTPPFYATTGTGKTTAKLLNFIMEFVEQPEEFIS